MTRRQRHVRILERFGRVGEHDRRVALARLGLDAFTDAAIESMVRATVAGWRADQAMIRGNRARREATACQPGAVA